MSFFLPCPQKKLLVKKVENNKILKANRGQKVDFTTSIPKVLCWEPFCLYQIYPISDVHHAFFAKIPWPPSSRTASFPWSRGGRAAVQAWEKRIIFLAKFTISTGFEIRI